MSDPTSDDGLEPTLLLKGPFPLPRFIRFIRERCPPGCFDEAMLVEEWKNARADALRQLKEEANDADAVEVHALPAEMAALADHAPRQPSMHRMTNNVPRAWQMVEIDRLVVFQECINLRHVSELAAAFPASPTAQDIMELVARNGRHAHPPVRASRSEGSYTFASSSNDLRFLDVATIDPSAIAGYEPFGAASHALVIYLGFSDNLVSATRIGNRLILTNGSHRLYLLRQLGLRHVPCLVTDASDSDFSDVLLPAAVKQDRAFYLGSARPPLFRDYFDPRLTRIVPVIRKNYALRATLDLQRITVPAV
ncbi:hypothetical protein [Stenotrophomonas maltophilia]|uniref:hypothetical protein n=1 Tax=Stenotrophomonas maltophilia TaxID=40324 RepID=UPI0007EFF1FD|nr:hypothetical protein [Stenotrophomonas maltophilia]MCU1020185.1 hypothetical protein [Stenotrophomonas maltophilia]OBU47918.1 hypothetical protein A9K76_18085 [Stenotrophomonas maltophilia]OBU48052.1 hypothetical protein A9K76_17475 [Stenotrophomonas maltophilia]OBU48826.1 hypothetical protein A9K76_13585 [Stenotrophomonas maltophilia]HDS1219737.1 hypothetical protein [Stenotrophomonas maltophilia]